MFLMQTSPAQPLTMLGTIHRDPEGRSLVEAWLNLISPDAVTVEFSQYGYLYRSMHGPALRASVQELAQELESDGIPVDRASLDGVMAYAEQPYEFLAAGDYAADRGIPLHLIDMDLFSWLNLQEGENLFNRENLTALMRGEGATENGEKGLARLFFDHGLCAFAYTEEMSLRDRHMSARLSSLLREGGYRSLVHICGWRHLCDPDGLYADLNPRKVFIYDRTVRL